MTLLRNLLTALAALCCTLALAAPAALPDFATARAQYRSSSTMVQGRSGVELARLRTDFDARRGQWTALADVSPALLRALLLSEDKRFYEHHGVDWRAATSAAWAKLRRHGTRGAHLLPLLTPVAAPLWPQVGIEQPHELHGQRRCAARAVPPQLGPGRRRGGAPVHAMVFVEALVL